MPDIRYLTLGGVTTILLFGTIYSVVYNTYLDTSNPLLTHLAHPLSSTHYFAAKSNPLNVYFIKQSWAWTSGVFILLWLTSLPSIRTQDRLAKYFTLTGIWILFTSWFFGPALLERLIVVSGGECVFPLPSGDLVTVPNELCYTRTSLTTQTHPHVLLSTFSLPADWRVVPRLRRGHDVSGHVFLLTMASLFLADQIRPSLRVKWNLLHGWAICLNLALLVIWLFATYTTSVYFHTPLEKLTGYLLGVSAFGLTQLPIWKQLFPPSPSSKAALHQHQD